MTVPDLTNLDDQEVFDRARRGDNDAWSEVVRRCRRSAFDVIYALVENRELTEDLAQETFIRAFRSLEHAGPERNPAACVASATSSTISRPSPNSLTEATRVKPWEYAV